MQKANISKIRIIGGKWRSRKISFIAVPGLRPTPDRIRETLFNWLAPVIEGARCLDMFTGSGAVSFEALSRGAKSAVVIDQSPKVIEMLKQNAALLKADNLEIYCGASPDFLINIMPRQFDIVFLDPPFRQNLIEPSATWLEEHHCLLSGSLIYIEAERELKELPIPKNWKIIRNKTAGNLGYYLCIRI